MVGRVVGLVNLILSEGNAGYCGLLLQLNRGIRRFQILARF
jgi:hypothetical protein